MRVGKFPIERGSRVLLQFGAKCFGIMGTCRVGWACNITRDKNSRSHVTRLLKQSTVQVEHIANRTGRGLYLTYKRGVVIWIRLTSSEPISERRVRRPCGCVFPDSGVDISAKAFSYWCMRHIQVNNSLTIQRCMFGVSTFLTVHRSWVCRILHCSQQPCTLHGFTVYSNLLYYSTGENPAPP